MNSKRQPEANPGGDQLARTIAGKIIKWQQCVATALNKRINRYSRKRQQYILAIFCAITASCLMICLLVPFGKIAMVDSGNNYQPAHIGLPSISLFKPGNPAKPTDSLTKLKR
jgi:hypothetical protein